MQIVPHALGLIFKILCHLPTSLGNKANYFPICTLEMYRSFKKIVEKILESLVCSRWLLLQKEKLFKYPTQSWMLWGLLLLMPRTQHRKIPYGQGRGPRGKGSVLSKLIVWLNVLCSSPHLSQSQGGEGSVGGMPVVLPWGFSPVSPVTDSWCGSQHVH